MAVYKFRVFIEDDHEIYRDVEIQGKQRFADLHRFIVGSFNFKQGQPAVYYSADQSWYVGNEVAELDENLSGDDLRIADHITAPHQRFVCETTSYNGVQLALELQKILKDEPNVSYPRCTRAEGDPPYYTQPPPEPITAEPEYEPGEMPAFDPMFDEDGPSEEDIEQIEIEAATASKKSDFKAPTIDFSKFSLSDDDDSEKGKPKPEFEFGGGEEDDDDDDLGLDFDDEDEDDGHVNFDNFDMEDL